MKVYEMPNFSRSLVTKSWVPPYRQSWARRWSPADSTVSREVEIAAMPLAVTSADSAISTDRKSTRLNSSHTVNSYAVFCLKKKNGRSRRRGQEVVPDDCLASTLSTRQR